MTYLAFVDSRVVVVGSFDDEVPVVGFGRMKDLDSLISCVNIMSVGQDVKVPSSYERYLQRMIRMWRVLFSSLPYFLTTLLPPPDKYILQKYIRYRPNT